MKSRINFSSTALCRGEKRSHYEDNNLLAGKRSSTETRDLRGDWMNGWPAELRLKTRKILDGREPFPKNGILPMEDIGGHSAYLKQADLRNGQIILYDSETQLTTMFQSAGELFDAGWVANSRPNYKFRPLTETESMTERHNVSGTEKSQFSHTVTTEANNVVLLKTCRAKDLA